MNLRDQAVLILGLGDSGLAMARWCAREGALVSVWDSRPEPPGAAVLAAELPAVQRVPLPEGAAIGRLRGVLKSPGLAPRDPRIAPLLQAARGLGIPVLGELDLFVAALAGLKATDDYAPQLLAVTGTNGKTTTTAMTALLVERAGRRVAVAGNIGPTLLDTLAAALASERAQWPEVWVLELSSFQLAGGGDGVRGFDPAAAAVLNLTQDHLDWHGSMAAYAAAKAHIFGPGSVAVINRDDAAVEAMLQGPPWVSTQPTSAVAPAAPAKAAGAASTGRVKPPRAALRSVLRFGLDAPRHPGDFGWVVDKGMAWLVRALPAEAPLKRGKGEFEEIHLQHLMPADALRVRGRHNAANALAALALATAIGCPLAPMLHALRDYAGEPHRVQPAGRVGEVEAYDDSKGTNVGATVAALVGLGADIAPARLVVILGGDGKGQDFAPLAAPIGRHARAVATIGRDAQAIEAALGSRVEAGIEGSNEGQTAGANEGAQGDSAGAFEGTVAGDNARLPWKRHASLEAAVAWCFDQARPGDAVLLSPACASLDMFRNYAHRAEVFVQAVQALARDRGEVA